MFTTGEPPAAEEYRPPTEAPVNEGRKYVREGLVGRISGKEGAEIKGRSSGKSMVYYSTCDG